MALIDFFVAVAVSMIDPLLLVGYVIAGVFTRSIREAAMWGVFAGCLIVGAILLVISDEVRAPHVASSLAQIAACGIGAVIVRSIAGMVARRRIAQRSVSQ